MSSRARDGLAHHVRDNGVYAAGRRRVRPNRDAGDLSTADGEVRAGGDGQDVPEDVPDERRQEGEFAVQLDHHVVVKVVLRSRPIERRLWDICDLPRRVGTGWPAVDGVEVVDDLVLVGGLL